jgi:hypothetical protein
VESSGDLVVLSRAMSAVVIVMVIGRNNKAEVVQEDRAEISRTLC